MRQKLTDICMYLLVCDARYKLRVLDAFGTEAIYNDDQYVESHPELKYKAGWARLDLHLKQFYTLYRMYSTSCFILPVHTHIYPFNSFLSRTTQVSWYQKGKTNLDFTEARDSEWQWHQLGHMQVCTSLQTDNRASTPPLSFFTDRNPFLLPYQQHQSTEGNASAGDQAVGTH